MNKPYTHSEHSTRCVAAAHAGIVLSRKHVQVRRGPVVCCARIVEALTLPQVGDCWKVDALFPWRGLLTVPVRNVRECQSVDGHCHCAGESSV